MMGELEAFEQASAVAQKARSTWAKAVVRLRAAADEMDRTEADLERARTAMRATLEMPDDASS
jgi:hypothetical protein